jgi:DNA-binding NtrC family response regulator
LIRGKAVFPEGAFESKMSKKKNRILIIDDNASILRAFSRVLSKAGYSVETAQTGKEASRKFMEKCFDAALIDVRLGEMQGTDLLPEMKKASPNMLKILFTGTPMPESMLDEAKRGADVFLLKPVKPETLLGILEERLERRNC